MGDRERGAMMAESVVAVREAMKEARSGVLQANTTAKTKRRKETRRGETNQSMKNIATAESLPLEKTVIGTETVIRVKRKIGIEIVIVTAETRRTNATSAQRK